MSFLRTVFNKHPVAFAVLGFLLGGILAVAYTALAWPFAQSAIAYASTGSGTIVAGWLNYVTTFLLVAIPFLLIAFVAWKLLSKSEDGDD